MPSYNGIADRKNLVHELTHVAQYQFKIPYNKQEKGYDYTLRPKKAFQDYGVEQQAMIVEDFFGRAHPYIEMIPILTDKHTKAKTCQWLIQESEMFKPHFQPSFESCPAMKQK